MKKTVLLLLSCLMTLSAMGQTAPDEDYYLADYLIDEWTQAFSAEGREQWKPEVTARMKLGIYSGAETVTGGVRVDSKRTLGVMLGHGTTFIDAAPGNVYHLETAAYMRRYVHLGKRDIFALYSDVFMGAAWVYKVTGDIAWIDPVTGLEEKQVRINQKPGDVHFMVGWEPGIRVRIYRNFHIFLGPTISNTFLGAHLGLGI